MLTILNYCKINNNFTVFHIIYCLTLRWFCGNCGHITYNNLFKIKNVTWQSDMIYTLDHTANATLLRFIISRLLIQGFQSKLEYDKMSYFGVLPKSFTAIDSLQDDNNYK